MLRCIGVHPHGKLGGSQDNNNIIRFEACNVIAMSSLPLFRAGHVCVNFLPVE